MLPKMAAYKSLLLRFLGSKMEKIKTNVALGSIDGEIAVFNEFYCERDLLTKEQKRSEHPFIQFANARNLPQLMIALDAMTQEMYMTDFIPAMFPRKKPAGVKSYQAEAVCRLFEDKVPTKTMLQRSVEALNAWDISHAKCKEHLLTQDKNAILFYFCTPLKDIIMAKKDLVNTSMMFAWLIEKIDFQVLHDHLTCNGTMDHFYIASDKDAPNLCEYYKKLANNTGNELWSNVLTCSTAVMNLDNEQKADQVLSEYVQKMFALLLSDERKVIFSDLTTHYYSNTILSAAWSFFSDGLNEVNKVDPINVCEQCHRFFQKKRSTKRYCSDSCRVMALKDSKSKNPSSFKTTVMCMREDKKCAEHNMN